MVVLWTQVNFYTMIGTHHFVFSPTPWILQTVAIVFRVGMLVPVVAGTKNFLLTMRRSWRTITRRRRVHGVGPSDGSVLPLPRW